MNIALNVNRSRINALGFVMALYLFTIGIMVSMANRYDAPAAWVFLTSIVPIIVGFLITLAAVVVLLVSQRLDSRGDAQPLTFAVGELLTYLALALTISGCLQNFVAAIGQLPRLAARTDLDPAHVPAVSAISDNLYAWLMIISGGAWFLIVYVLPMILLRRIDLAKKSRAALAGGYVISLFLLFWILAHPYQIKSVAAGNQPSMLTTWARQFVQPTLWREHAPRLVPPPSDRGH